ncbi:MAG: MFS transporter [Anaerolineae bacterium]|jgi:fucose permease
MPAQRADRWPSTIGYFAVFVVLGMETSILGPTLPGLAQQTAAQLAAISYLFTGHALGYMGGSFFGGRLYDRVPGHLVVVAMLALMATVLVLVPWIPVLWLLIPAWILLGVSGGALDVGGNTLMIWVHGRQVGPFMNALHFFFGLGSFLIPIIVAQAMALSGSFPWAYRVLALLVIPVALWMARVPSPASPNATNSQADSERQAGAKTQPGVDARRTVILICLLLGLYVGAEAAFGGWIYTYAVALDLSDVTTAAYLTSAFWGALTVGRLLAIPLATRFRPRSILFADLTGCLLSVGILLAGSGSVTATWLGAMGLGLSMASIFPTAMSLAEHRIPITGQVTGWFLVSASIGGMLLPWLIGQLFEPIGPQLTMLAILLDLVAAMLVLIVLVRATRPQAA